MNFYIGDLIETVDVRSANVEFSDELMEFIYKLSKYAPLDMSKLYGIDPYKDVEVPKNDLCSIIEICNYILDASLFQNYKKAVEAEKMLQDLIKIAKEAISRDLGLISIGD